jgi:hypothetical protein
MTLRLIALAAGWIAAAGAVAPADGDLQPAAVAAFDRYARLTEQRMAAEIDGRSPLLWIDRQPASERSALVARLRAGEVVSERLQTRDGAKEIEAEGALIHHWIGTVLLPGATLDRTRAFVEAYERYPQTFGPLIQRARVLKRTGERFDVAMRTATSRGGLDVVIDADYAIEYRRVAPARLVTRSEASNIFEVHDAGAPGESRTPAARGRGYLYRLNTYCSFEERPEGTYEQCESVSLTTGIPWMFAWIVKPFVMKIPRDTLEFTLSRVRAGLTAARSNRPSD